MNREELAFDETLATLKSWAADPAASAAAQPAFLDTLAVLAARSLSVPAPPADLVARPCRLSVARWHAECLRQLTQKTDGSPLRRACHAQWLLYALSGWDPVEAPLVSIIIPVYNRADMAIEAVESCLRQTYSRYEIVLVDDGSEDHLETLVRPYVERGQVVYAKKDNGGVSSARNLGVKLARGHYLHFLDSDNLLNPDSLSRWMAAFTAVPDAELCYAPSEILAGPGVARNPAINHAPTGALDCPTTNLMRCVVRRYPFLVGSVMLPRWVVAEAGAFDTTLRRSEDTLYWFKLALRGTKVVGLRNPNNRRRVNKENLSEASREEQLPDLKLARLISLTDLFHSPLHWIYAGRFIRMCLWPDNAFHWAGYGHPLWSDALARFIDSIRQLKEAGDQHGLSSRPLLALLAFHVFSAEPHDCRDKAVDQSAQAVAAAVGQAWYESAPLTVRDVEAWFYPEQGAVYPADFPALWLIMQEIDARRASPRPVIEGMPLKRLLERVETIRRAGQAGKT